MIERYWVTEDGRIVDATMISGSQKYLPVEILHYENHVIARTASPPSWDVVIKTTNYDQAVGLLGRDGVVNLQIGHEQLIAEFSPTPTKETKKRHWKATFGIPGLRFEFGRATEISGRAQDKAFIVLKSRLFADYLGEFDDWEESLRMDGRWSQRKELPSMAWLAIKSTVASGFGIGFLVQNLSWFGKLKRR